jgi:predicted SAM-dependent methyltransferase
VGEPLDDPERWLSLARMPEQIPVRSLEELPLSRLAPAELEALGIAGVQFGCLDRLAPAVLNVDLVQMRDTAGRTTSMNGLYRVDGTAVCLRQDALQPLPCRDASFDFAYAEHFVEHLHPGEARRWLTEVRRIVRPGGLVRLTTPDLRRYVEGYLDPDAAFFAEHRAMMESMGCPVMPSRRAWMLNQIFMFWGHRWIYDVEELTHLLVTAGFSAETIRRRAFREGRDARVSAMDSPLRRDETLYVEVEIP